MDVTVRRMACAVMVCGWLVAVEEGRLVRRADGAGDLLTRETFEHFIWPHPP